MNKKFSSYNTIHPFLLFFWAVNICILFFLAVIYSQIWIFIIAISFLLFFSSIIKDEFNALLIYFLANALIEIQPRSEVGSFYNFIAGGIVGIILLVYSLKFMFFSEEKKIYHYTQYAFIVFYLWGIIIGLGSFLLNFQNTFITFFLETQVLLPFLIVPILLVRTLEKKEEREVKLAWIVVGIWLVTLFANILNIRDNVIHANYLFEIGRGKENTYITSFVFLILVSFFFMENRKKNILLYGGTFLALCGLLISFWRTIYLTDFAMIGLMYLLSRKEERKQGTRSFFIFASIMAGIVFILYFIAPFLVLVGRFYILRFQSSSHFQTDPSLVNRYIEWRGIWNTIKNFPITGLGFGAMYKNFVWIKEGQSEMNAYSHNGYLYLFLKTGLVGFIFIAVCYLGIIKEGVKLLRTSLLQPYQRALVRGAVAFLISMLFTNITLNTLTMRDSLLTAGLIWGYIIYLDRKISGIKILKKQELL